MRLDLEIAGEAAVKKKLEELVRRYPDAAGAALYQEGMGVWRDAVKKAPVQFGVLRSSAYVSPPMKDGQSLSVEIGFGTRYAVFQHEGRNLHHPRGGEAGYLRNALDERAAGYLERLAERIQQNVERGVAAPAIAAPTAPSVSGSGRRSSKSGKRLRAARRGRL